MTKTEEYIARILREQPKTTKGGTPVEISSDGKSVRTYTGRSRDGISSTYLPMDYPNLFGWNNDERKSTMNVTNEFGKEVVPVNNVSIRRVQGGHTVYELQLNDQYFQISETQIEAIESILRLPEGVGLSLG